MDDSFEKKKSALAKPLDVHSGIAGEHYETRHY